jgi:hypothetical protein
MYAFRYIEFLVILDKYYPLLQRQNSCLQAGDVDAAFLKKGVELIYSF